MSTLYVCEHKAYFLTYLHTSLLTVIMPRYDIDPFSLTFHKSQQPDLPHWKNLMKVVFFLTFLIRKFVTVTTCNCYNSKNEPLLTS